ncbi:MAG: SusD/RagB family nutrient-binding outer membrane lipoprotein, partial [Pedobacter sp.]
LDNLTPKYDAGADVYKDLADQLDSASHYLDLGDASVSTFPLGTSDVMFAGNISRWRQFINTLKLKILVTGNGKVTFSNPVIGAGGFLATDAQIDPGYTKDNAKQNPKWNQWAYTSTNSDATKSWMVNEFVYSFYDGTKLSDEWRDAAIYYHPADPADFGINRLGIESNDLNPSPSPGFWYPSSDRGTGITGNSTGVLKGPAAQLPIITAAESEFLQAEAAVRGIAGVTNAQTHFENGIKASFKYLYTDALDQVQGDPAGDAADYMDENDGSRLVNFTLAAGTEQQIEDFNADCGLTAEQERAKVKHCYYYGNTTFFVYDSKAELTSIDLRSGKFTYRTPDLHLSRTTTLQDVQKVYPNSVAAAINENGGKLVRLKPCK